MIRTLPKIIPINELKNTAKVSEMCSGSDTPIVVTKNGRGDMVLMSVRLYDEMTAEMRAAAMVNEALDEEEAGAEPMDGDEFFSAMREKYGK